ncbi:MAG: NhaP-type Na+/H+ or K+/H+ antiporter [Clostridium sp.]|jgi:NhaP-type Na+/H+ or K+/H+ antiporter
MTLYRSKKLIKMNTKNNNVTNKSHFVQRLIELIAGFCYIVLGLILLLKLFNVLTFGFLTLAVVSLIKIIKIIISKRYKDIKW